MQKIFNFITCLAMLSACGGGSALDQRKKEIKDFKAEALKIQAKIKTLEQEVIAMDPDYQKVVSTAISVTALDIKPAYFQHRIQVRGAVESRTNVNVSTPIPGEIKTVLVKEGERVKSGQLLIAIDNEVVKNSIEELKTGLALSNTIYEKQKKLWEQNIGSEIQYLKTKHDKETLERKLATTEAQLRQSRITAPFAGTVDAVMAKKGEMAMPGTPLCRINNPKDVYIRASVSERFIGQFKKNDKVKVYFPAQDKEATTKIKSVSQIINSQNRTFDLEVALPKVDFSVRPNQIVVLSMKDYENPEALKVPTILIQKDRQGTYVYELVGDQGQATAKKLHVKTGVSFDGDTEILAGIAIRQKIANKGYRELSEGVAVQVISESSLQDATL